MLSAQDFCKFIQDVQQYQSSIKLNRNGEDVAIDTSTFNIKSYLIFFDKLKVDDRKKVDIYYQYNWGAGEPCLYAIDTNKNIDKIIDSLSLLLKEESRICLIFKYTGDSTRSALNYLTPENSRIGFLQYLFFARMGDQFALYWHSNYGKMNIICTKEMINSFIKEHTDNDWFNVDKESLEKLSNISPNIDFEESENQFKISWLENRTHSGVYKCLYSIDKQPPFKISLVDEELIARINIQFVY